MIKRELKINNKTASIVSPFQCYLMTSNSRPTRYKGEVSLHGLTSPHYSGSNETVSVVDDTGLVPMTTENNENNAALVAAAANNSLAAIGSTRSLYISSFKG